MELRLFWKEKLLVVYAAASALLPSYTARAQQNIPDPNAVRLAPYFLLGFGGDVEVETGAFSGEVDLDPTIGAGVRLEIPVHQYVSVGGLFQASFMKPDGADDRARVLDVSPLIKGRYLFTGGRFPVEAHAVLPVGFSVAIPHPDVNGETAYGWNIGFLLGATVFISPSIGLMGELGFMHHSVSNDTEVLGTEVEVDTDVNQGRFHLGAAFAL